MVKMAATHQAPEPANVSTFGVMISSLTKDERLAGRSRHRFFGSSAEQVNAGDISIDTPRQDCLVVDRPKLDDAPKYREKRMKSWIIEEQ